LNDYSINGINILIFSHKDYFWQPLSAILHAFLFIIQSGTTFKRFDETRLAVYLYCWWVYTQ